MTDLAAALRARIAAQGPIRLDHWMAACNTHYYATRDPLGAAGDFTTAPEISQMFGELIGAWIADLWTRAGRPPLHLAELGPGRGTLIADAWRVLARTPGFTDSTTLHLVETSPLLRAAQASRVAATWHDSLDTVPRDRPLIVIANEFLDALPIRQSLGHGEERAVGLEGDRFVPLAVAASSPLPPGEREGPARFFSGWEGEGAAATTNTIHVQGTQPLSPPGETCEPATTLITTLATRITTQGGAVLLVDYGYTGPPALDSLQAVRHHAKTDPFATPGASDLTAHVDFTALTAAAAPLHVHGPIPQGLWLTRLGIEARAATLKTHATPTQAAQIEAALVRLTAPTAMGALFKVMALTAPHWPTPAGFDS